MRLVEFDLDLIVVSQADISRGCLMPVTNLNVTTKLLRNVDQPVQSISGQRSPSQLFPRPNHYLFAFRLKSDHIPWLAECDAKAFALTDGKSFVAVVLSNDRARRVDNLTGGVLLSAVSLKKFGVVVIWNEADFLAVWLVEDSQAGFLRFLADFQFLEVANGENDPVEQVSVDPEKDVGLIFGAVQAAVQSWPGVSSAKSCVVTRCYEVGPDLLGEMPQLPELQPVVTLDDGVRRAAGLLFVSEVVLNSSECVLEVQSVKRDVQHIGDATCIGCIGCPAAALSI